MKWGTMRKKKTAQALMCILMTAVSLIGCKEAEKSARTLYQPTKEELSHAFPKIGEAAIGERGILAETKGTITVASVGSPHTEILQEAEKILAEQGYLLKIEVCEDYETPNRLVSEGKADCSYYQHQAFLERYNIKNSTSLTEVAKIHYEPMAVYSRNLNSLSEVTQGAEVFLPGNPTALAQALWLLQEEGLLTLMRDADLSATLEDILENPLKLELKVMEEEEILKHSEDAELLICHAGYLLREGMDDGIHLLAAEKKESMAASMLAHTVVADNIQDENAKRLVRVLLSEQMQEFIEEEYQGSIYMMDDTVPDQETEEGEDGKAEN